jgi:hypothetical protein
VAGFLRRIRAVKESLDEEAWRIRWAVKTTGQLERARQLRIENPDEYQRILGSATEEGQRLVEIDPDRFVAFVLADTKGEHDAGPE